MKIYLVRHGETDWNLQERMQGQADNQLNDTGRKQAQIVADKLRGITFDAAFSSTLCSCYGRDHSRAAKRSITEGCESYGDRLRTMGGGENIQSYERGTSIA